MSGCSPCIFKACKLRNLLNRHESAHAGFFDFVVKTTEKNRFLSYNQFVTVQISTFKKKSSKIKVQTSYEV